MELKELEYRVQEAKDNYLFWKDKYQKQLDVIKMQERKQGDRVNIRKVKQMIDEMLGVNIESSRRDRDPFVWGRNVFCYLARTYSDATLERIAKMLNRNHATVINAVHNHENLQNDYVYKKFSAPIIEKFNQEFENLKY